MYSIELRASNYLMCNVFW